MPYWEMVTRSFRISWRHKYLWLLAFFAGESGGGFNFNSGSSSPPGTSGNGKTPDLAAINQQISDWLAHNIGLDRRCVSADHPGRHRTLRAGCGV